MSKIEVIVNYKRFEKLLQGGVDNEIWCDIIIL